MRINTNVAALSANRNMAEASGAAGKSIERLSSGLRINRAADDASGLVIAEKLKAQSNGINVAVRNAQDGIGLVQTADGALTEVTNILHRMRDLAMHSANGATTGEARDANQSEFTQLSDELTRISETTSFAGQKLLDGTLNTTLNVSQTGAATDAIDLIVADELRRGRSRCRQRRHSGRRRRRCRRRRDRDHRAGHGPRRRDRRPR